ncbi:DUF4124 domain-containing protein [Vandammella animalimorsus]|uniref:DUF4124 domain-containing protein n=1 Tax=Vandammella animalimorsus TaxID=2029117 RepID=A0A2A2AXM4_9BURK|nr:DUF4124 domain-containing protein [Vandammella animalimorsus]PAT42523.1 hypothetical protein CK621_08380 [Vandammella animalimorsus]
MRTLIAIALLLMTAGPAAAVHKCKGQDGKIVFQDMPCVNGVGQELKLRPASGHVPTSAVSADAHKTRTEQLREKTEELRRKNRLRDLEIAIPNARRAISVSEHQCQREIDALRRKQPLANNNLAGATWLQSLATEMEAVSTRCAAKRQQLDTDLQRLLAERDELRKG